MVVGTSTPSSQRANSASLGQPLIAHASQFGPLNEIASPTAFITPVAQQFTANGASSPASYPGAQLQERYHPQVANETSVAQQQYYLQVANGTYIAQQQYHPQVANGTYFEQPQYQGNAAYSTPYISPSQSEKSSPPPQQPVSTQQMIYLPQNQNNSQNQVHYSQNQANPQSQYHPNVEPHSQSTVSAQNTTAELLAEQLKKERSEKRKQFARKCGAETCFSIGATCAALGWCLKCIGGFCRALS